MKQKRNQWLSMNYVTKLKFFSSVYGINLPILCCAVLPFLDWPALYTPLFLPYSSIFISSLVNLFLPFKSRIFLLFTSSQVLSCNHIHNTVYLSFFKVGLTKNNYTFIHFAVGLSTLTGKIKLH